MGVFAKEGRIRGSRLDGTAIADWRYERAVGSIALSLNGLVAAMADGFYRIEGDGRSEPVALVGTARDTIRLNDGKTDRTGQFLSGQMELAEQTPAAAALWRLDRRTNKVRLAERLRIANAICFSPAGDVLYFADSQEGFIRAHQYDPSSAALGPRVGTIDCRPHGSVPDGATVDAAGNLWVAMVTGQAIACFAPDGRLLRRIELPIPFPTCPAFGGPGLDTLFVTTLANSGRHFKTDHPDGGRILAIDGLGARGIAETRWH